MSGNLKKYKEMLAGLLPRGRAWEFVKKHPFLEGLAGELCRVDDMAEVLLREIDPAQTDELLEDYLAMTGIPDECTPSDLNNIELRNQMVQKLATQGALNAAFYIEVAENLGVTGIEVEKAQQFQMGSVMGDALNTYAAAGQFRMGDTVGTQLHETRWRYVFIATIPISESEVFMMGDRMGKRLREFGNELLECTFLKLKPAHGQVFFKFVE